jgi:ribosomal protein L19
MPVVGRGDRNRVEVLVVERPANVLDALRRFAGLVLETLGPAFEQAAVNVNQVANPTIV